LLLKPKELARAWLPRRVRSRRILSGPLQGQRIVTSWHDYPAALPGTIRGDLGRDWGTSVQQNIVHGSDSPESAERELGIWFPDL